MQRKDSATIPEDKNQDLQETKKQKISERVLDDILYSIGNGNGLLM